jgi:hypothetical protein
MTVSHGAVIAVQGPKDSLRFYRADGPSTWHAESASPGLEEQPDAQ